MRLFVALCLAWLATLSPRATERAGAAPASISAIAAREASPLLQAHGPQLATVVVIRASTPQTTLPPHVSPWSQVVPAGLRAPHSTRAVAAAHAASNRVAASGAVAPHFATAPPVQS